MIRSAIAALLASGLALLLAACASVPQTAAAPHPQARAYAADADAHADVDAALARAAASGKRVLLVMGANWCHDSRALAGWLETPRFAALVGERYELVFVDVGMPQTGEGRNLDIAARFGVTAFKNTPALLVLTPEGRALNADTARDWRNAASRSEDAIYDELVALASPAATPTPSMAAAPITVRMADATVWIGSDAEGCRFALSPEGPWVSQAAELTGLPKNPTILLRSAEGASWRCVAAGVSQFQGLGAKVAFAPVPASGSKQPDAQ